MYQQSFSSFGILQFKVSLSDIPQINAPIFLCGWHNSFITRSFYSKSNVFMYHILISTYFFIWNFLLNTPLKPKSRWFWDFNNILYSCGRNGWFAVGNSFLTKFV